MRHELLRFIRTNTISRLHGQRQNAYSYSSDKNFYLLRKIPPSRSKLFDLLLFLVNAGSRCQKYQTEDNLSRR